MPDIGEGIAEGEIVHWFVKEGDVVREDAPLVSVLTDKANVEIPSPRTALILKIHAQEGEKVKVGAPLVTFGQGSVAPSSKFSEMPRGPAPAPVSAAPAMPLSTGPPAPTGGEPSVLATPYVRRRAAELGVNLAGIKGSGPGGRVTDADLESLTTASSAARSESVPPTQLPLPTESPKAPPAPPESPPPPIAPAKDADMVERIPLRGIRRVIAEHMTEAMHKAAHYTYVEEIDATELVRHRDRLAKHIEKRGPKLSYLPFIIKAVVAGLAAFPRVNATMDDARQELVVHRDFNIGIATAAPEGLVVPVIHGADHKSLAKLAEEIQTLSDKARAGKLTLPEMSGGTFTITSLGALGGLLATPILNYPEVAILGVHQIKKRPVYQEDGSIGAAHLMNLSLSLDHRVLDGIVGAQFMSVVKANLEDPHLMFAEMA